MKDESALIQTFAILRLKEYRRISPTITSLLRICSFAIAAAIIVAALLFSGTSTPAQAQSLSTDATLSSLTLSGTTFQHPAFSPAKTEYAVQVGIDMSETTVTATASHWGASVVVKRRTSFGSWVDSYGSATVPLERGRNWVRVVVTAQNRTTTKTYYLLITRTATPFPTLGELSTDDPPVNFRATGSGHDWIASQWEVPRDRHISEYELRLHEHNGSGFVPFRRPITGNAGGGYQISHSSIDLKPDTLYRYDLDLMNDALIPIIQKSITVRTEPKPAPKPPASSDATLSNLTLSGIDIGTFDPDTTSYTASVPNSVTQTTVTPTLNDSGARYTITANNIIYVGLPVQLRGGTNTIEIEVTAADGQTKKTYTVTVTRARPPATLSSLTLSGVSISFDWDTTSYTASVANSVTQTTVTASVHSSGDTYVVKLNGVTDSDGVIPLAVGSNVITVEVTSQDGNSTRTYTVTVTRAAPPTPLSTDATLSSLTLSGTTFQHPAFSPAKTEYAVQVGIDMSETTVTATASHWGASVVVKRRTSFGSWVDSYGSATVPLERGRNWVRVVVTAQDRTTTKTYYLLITRTATPFPTLGELSTDDPPVNFRATGSGHDWIAAQWEVPRDRHISEYELRLHEHNGSGFVPFRRPNTGEASGGYQISHSSIDLKPDTLYRYDLDLMNDALIPIIEASVTVRTLPLPDSTDATLSSLTLRDIDFGAFDPDTTSYTASVPNSIANTAIAPTPSEKGATFLIVANGVEYPNFLVKVVSLEVGVNTIEIRVTSEDGETNKTYTVIVTRAATPDSSETTPTPTNTPTPEPTPTPTATPELTPTNTPTPEPTPTPTATPVATEVPEEITNRLSALESLVETLQEVIRALTSRIAALEAEEPAVATPIPTTTPSPVAPTPTLTSSPLPVDDACIERINDSDTIHGNWAAECESKSTSPHDGGVRYARFYTFTLDEAFTITVNLTSKTDSYLYILEGAGKSGRTLHENDDIDSSAQNYNSRIAAKLQPGDYTIEATTYYAEKSGEFILTVEGLTPES